MSCWGKGLIQERPVVLAKPMTFMNLSGVAVKSLLEGLNLSPERLIIIHDDIDLILGKIKVKAQGGDAGHKGVRSIIERLATDRFYRIRLGIGRPARKEEVIDYVLSDFTPQEEDTIAEGIQEAIDRIEELVEQEEINIHSEKRG